MTRKRVVITGLAAVSPLGNDVRTSWDNLLAGKCGIGPITRFDASAHETKIAGEVKDFHPEQFMPVKQVRRMDLFTQYAVACGMMVIKDAGWEKLSQAEAERTGVIIGCGLGGLDTIEVYHKKLLDGGPGRISPFFIPILIANMAAGQVSIFTGAKGPNVCATSACASGLHGIGYAYSEIILGRADAMICGGTESTITPLAIGGFNAMKALSTFNENPQIASRPFDKDRDGFVMGEGCGLLVLETLERAKARGARIYAEIVGFGAAGDAYHIAAPEETGDGMARAMRAALSDANLSPEAVDHINAHATSTPVGDIIETKAVKAVFGSRAQSIPVVANKSQMGHLLGAAGGVESVFSVLTIAEGVIPGTINVAELDPQCDLDYVLDGPRKQKVDCVLCNSFGFGGTNASLLFKRYEG